MFEKVFFQQASNIAIFEDEKYCLHINSSSIISRPAI